ncbi:MAG TPA: cobalamin biosynthesis protein CobN, partial [Candidatus Bathyarchaeota archaeon]|nr:cobalamin biosynthesis protein CobN [Candidatus Bathyarchaeota archaeon]
MTTKIAFITTIPSDAAPFISAVKSVNKKVGIEAVNALFKTGGDFRDFGALDEFIQFAKKSHLVIVHLMGELPDFDLLLSTLKSASVPVVVVSSVLIQNKEFQKLSTIDKKDYQKIVKYLNYGGKNNFENLLLHVANRFTGTSYKFDAPEQQPLEGICHPDFEYLPTLEEYISKKIVPDRPTVGIWFHQTQWQSQDIRYINSLIKEIEHQGANSLPVFFGGTMTESTEKKGLECIIENYFMEEGKPT